MVKFNLNLKQFFSLADDFSEEEFKAGLEQFSKDNFIEYHLELSKEQKDEDDSSLDDLDDVGDDLDEY